MASGTEFDFNHMPQFSWDCFVLNPEQVTGLRQTQDSIAHTNTSDHPRTLLAGEAANLFAARHAKTPIGEARLRVRSQSGEYDFVVRLHWMHPFCSYVCAFSDLPKHSGAEATG